MVYFAVEFATFTNFEQLSWGGKMFQSALE